MLQIDTEVANQEFSFSEDVCETQSHGLTRTYTESTMCTSKGSRKRQPVVPTINIDLLKEIDGSPEEESPDAVTSPEDTCVTVRDIEEQSVHDSFQSDKKTEIHIEPYRAQLTTSHSDNDLSDYSEHYT